MNRGALAAAGITVALSTTGAWVGADGAGESSDHARHGRHHHGGGAAVEAVVLRNSDGDRVGRVWLRQKGAYVRVWARLHSLPAGFHGFHIHEFGRCEPDDPAGAFKSAGGHYNPADPAHPDEVAHHGEHPGDLPSLFATSNGSARLSFRTDAFSLADLRDSDGSAVMIHEGRDNFANIPDDRYDSAEGPEGEVPDTMTLASGDAGDRYACGVID